MDPRRRPDDHLVEPLFAAFHGGEGETARRGRALRRAVTIALVLLAIVLGWAITVGAAECTAEAPAVSER